MFLLLIFLACLVVVQPCNRNAVSALGRALLHFEKWLANYLARIPVKKMPKVLKKITVNHDAKDAMKDATKDGLQEVAYELAEKQIAAAEAAENDRHNEPTSSHTLAGGNNNCTDTFEVAPYMLILTCYRTPDKPFGRHIQACHDDYQYHMCDYAAGKHHCEMYITLEDEKGNYIGSYKKWRENSDYTKEKAYKTGIATYNQNIRETVDNPSRQCHRKLKAVVWDHDDDKDDKLATIHLPIDLSSGRSVVMVKAGRAKSSDVIEAGAWFTVRLNITIPQ